MLRSQNVLAVALFLAPAAAGCLGNFSPRHYPPDSGDAEADADADGDLDGEADVDSDNDIVDSDPEGDDDTDPDPEQPWASGLERCGDAVDDDGDGLVDEDCPPSLFSGVFVPGGAEDPTLAALEEATERAQSVIQTYHSTSELGISRIGPDLAAIWGSGRVAHLNVEPSGYTEAQYSDADTDPQIGEDLAALASVIAESLSDAPGGRLLLTFGAEMNGSWTDWGCLPTATYVAFYRRAHDAVRDALAAQSPPVDPRRVRWVYGPNSTTSASCGSAAGYYPGDDAVDYLGMSAYRSGDASVEAALLAPARALVDDLGYPEAWQEDRFILLQTGTRAISGDDRGAWLDRLYASLAAEQSVAGVIYFDDADWRVDEGGPGWDDWVAALRALPTADARLEAMFEPYFWDVRPSHLYYPEAQALRAAGVTTGCQEVPPLYCPDDPLLRRQAAILLSRAFRIEPDEHEPQLFDDVAPADFGFGEIQAIARRGALSGCDARLFCPGEPVLQHELASAIGVLGGSAPDPPVPGAPVDRGMGGSWIVRGAYIPPAPRLP